MVPWEAGASASQKSPTTQLKFRCFLFFARKSGRSTSRSRFSGSQVTARNRLYFRCLHHHMMEKCFDKAKKILETVANSKKDKTWKEAFKDEQVAGQLKNAAPDFPAMIRFNDTMVRPGGRLSTAEVSSSTKAFGQRTC